MDLNRLISMILNMVLRKVVNRGVNAGIDHVARRGKPTVEMTPDEKLEAQKARQLAQRARQAAKITGRLGR